MNLKTRWLKKTTPKTGQHLSQLEIWQESKNMVYEIACETNDLGSAKMAFMYVLFSWLVNLALLKSKSARLIMNLPLTNLLAI
jgi:hypothetical protein